MKTQMFILICTIAICACRSNVKEEARIIDRVEIQQDKVIEKLKTNVKEHPTVAKNYALLANQYIEEKQYNDAIKLLRVGIRKTDSGQQLYDELIRAYLHKGDTENAKKYVDELKMSSEDPSIFFQLAKYNFQTGNYTTAYDLINKAIAYDKGNAAFYLQKGQVQLALEDTTTALQTLMKGVECENAETDNFYVLTDLLIERGSMDKTEQVLKQAIKKFPDNTRLAYNYAQFLEQSGKTEAAKQKYRALMDTEEAFKAKDRLMNIYLNGRNYDSLNMIIDQTLDEHPKNIAALLYSARVENRFRRYQNALELYRKILSIDSTHTIATEELDKLQRKLRYLRRMREREKEREESKDMTPIYPNR